MGKFRPGSAKAESRLAGMKLFPCDHRIKFMKSLLYCRDPGKAGQNFIPAKRGHVITPVIKLFCLSAWVLRSVINLKKKFSGRKLNLNRFIITSEIRFVKGEPKNFFGFEFLLRIRYLVFKITQKSSL